MPFSLTPAYSFVIEGLNMNIKMNTFFTDARHCYILQDEYNVRIESHPSLSP